MSEKNIADLIVEMSTKYQLSQALAEQDVKGLIQVALRYDEEENLERFVRENMETYYKSDFMLMYRREANNNK